MKINDPTIKSRILREAGRRRNKYLKVALSEDEYALLMKRALDQDMTMADVIRHKIFKDKRGI